MCEYCIEAEALPGVWDCAIDTPHGGFLTLYITAFWPTLGWYFENSTLMLRVHCRGLPSPRHLSGHPSVYSTARCARPMHLRSTFGP